MSPKIARNIEATVVIVGAVALLIMAPEEWFLYVSGAMLAGGIAGTMGAKKYIERLDARARELEKAGEPQEATMLRVRKLMVVDVGMAFAIVGLIAFIAMVVVYGD
jgi:hypothetical protein